ncbi:MAG: ribonuclease HII [Hyphomicrobiales bacterium]
MGGAKDSGNGQPAGRPSLRHERALAKSAGGLVCGVDEAGRGPLAGPVFAAAVILDPKHIPAGIDDSKKLTAETRETLYAEIMRTAWVGIAFADVETIDRENILQASLMAMALAVSRLPAAPAAALIDGNRCPTGLPCPSQALIGGDGLSVTIAAASIVAKVARDRVMRELHEEFPLYGWSSNKGYGTPGHTRALREHGATLHHRRSFAPVRMALEATRIRLAG